MKKLTAVMERLGDTLRRSEIAPYLLDFSKPEEQKEYLLMNGQPARANETYINIYARAKKTIIIVDDYINIKTLRLLQDVQAGVAVTVFSDNQHSGLHASDVADFHTEFPGIGISFYRTAGSMHDRFIVLDYGTADEIMFLCGSSSMDSGVRKTTAIVELESPAMRAGMHTVIDKLKGNPPLVL